MKKVKNWMIRINIKERFSSLKRWLRKKVGTYQELYFLLQMLPKLTVPIIVISIAIVAMFSNIIGVHYENWRYIGIILPSVLGIFTLLGLMLAISNLMSIHSRILSFEHFLHCANRLIKEASGSNSPIKILCHSPLIGNLSSYETPEFKKFENWLKKNEIRYEFICLDWTKEGDSDRKSELDRFYELYSKEGRFPLEFVEARKKDAENYIVNKLQLAQTSWTKCEFTGQSYVNIPHFYLIISEKKAVVSSIFYLPGYFIEHKQINTSGQVNKAGNNSVEEPKNIGKMVDFPKWKVEILGFETRDMFILEKLFNAFEYYKQLPKSHKLKLGGRDNENT